MRCMKLPPGQTSLFGLPSGEVAVSVPNRIVPKARRQVAVPVVVPVPEVVSPVDDFEDIDWPDPEPDVVISSGEQYLAEIARITEAIRVIVNTPPPVPEVIFPAVSSVTLHKSKKRLLMKADDVWAADLLREVKERLDNDVMRDFQYLLGEEVSNRIDPVKELNELWRYALTGLDAHPYKRVLESYGIQVNLSPTLVGYMRKSKKRMQMDLAPFPCYESSDPDLGRCVKPGMILKARIDTDAGIGAGKRYMVASVAEGVAHIYAEALQGRTMLSGDAATLHFPVSTLNPIFEDGDQYVVGDTILDLYPEAIEQQANKLNELPIGAKIFKHVRQDVPAESLKQGFLCSKEMRMGKGSEGLSVCEVIGSKRVAWIGPSDAQVDTVREFAKRDVFDFQEITTLSDLAVEAKYHIMTFDFVKKGLDPLLHARKGNTDKTWLRLMGEGKHEANCPHCDQTLERPIKTLDVLGRVISVDWVNANGYICRNPECTWDERHKEKKKGLKSTWVRYDKKNMSTHAGAAWDLGFRSVGHRKCYIDWERKAHAECGDHVGRKRMCPKCGMVDATWVPGTYKRIKKNYNTVLIDEVHMTANSSSGTSKAALDFRGKHHIAMTGTPISNNLVDMFEPLLWTVKGPNLRFPFGANDKSAFKARFCQSVHIQREGSKGHYKVLPYPKDPVDLWGFLAPIVVRRTRADAVYLESLSELNLKLPILGLDAEHLGAQVMPVRMVPEQAVLMLNSIEVFREDFAEYCAEVEASGHGINESLVIGQMSRMKIAATVPEMLNKPGQARIYNGEPMGGKACCLRTLLPAKIMEGKKIVVMSDFVLMRELLYEEFKHLNPVFMKSGNVKVKGACLAEFREGPSPLLIAGFQQVTNGIDLSCADVLVACDLMWKAAKQNQALARLMGATARERFVELYILNSQHSIDEHVYNVFYGKIAGAEQALDHHAVTLTARDINWKSFVDQIVDQEEQIANYLREPGEEAGIVLPDFGDDVLMERWA